MKRIFALLLTLVMVCSLSVSAFAAPVDEATIDMSRTGNIDLWKYDLTNAEKDGLWDSSYVSTGVRDVNGVENVLGDAERLSPLNENGTAYGYALKGVEFTYLRVADIRTYTEAEDGVEHIDVLYGFPKNNALLTAIGVTADDRYAKADQKIGGVQYYYFQSDVLIDALKTSLENNATVVKNALENYAITGGGTKLAETDAYGHTEAKDLPLGLYLFVETKVPEMVTETTAPFLVSVPMTSVNGTNANDGGTRWIYDIALYPKNLTGIPTLEKTLRETMADTGKNGGSATDITDGYAHTGTASDGDVIDYQIISTLPSITSSSTYLSEYSFVDTLSSGLSYNGGDVVLTFFRDAACQNKVTTWKEEDGKFRVTYNTLTNGDNVMTIEMTNDGLNEINTSRSVYTGVHMVNSGYSDCTLRITYTATMNADDNVVYGDEGNDNAVVMTWRRSNSSYYDTLVDDCHVYSYGIDLTKRFSDGKGDFKKVEFILHNDVDNYFVQAKLSSEGLYYVTGHTDKEAEATHFIPASTGKLLIKGLEDDDYTMTEVRTDNGYTLLKDSIKIVISSVESDKLCTIYGTDVLGLLQNDTRYAIVEPGLFHNMPQKHLEHKLMTASATVDKNDVNMKPDESSVNAFVPFTVINTRGFDLPQTGGMGNWMFPVFGLSAFALCVFAIFMVCRKKKAPTSK